MQPQPTPFLDWYGIWPSHRKLEEDGTVWSQDPPRGIELTPELARKSEVFFHKERPWEQGANLHVNAMLHTEGRYRLWYGVQRLEDLARSYVCYAESDDGFAWRRPELGLCEYEGSTRNNIISAGLDHPLGWVFIDPAAPPAERYKAVGPGACWDPDRLAGIEAQGEGRVTLIERPCCGRQLLLNFRTAPDGWIKVEIVRTIHTPPRPVEAHPGFSLAEADPLTGDSISEAARWRGRADLAVLAGESVGLRFHLYKAKLFSVSI